MSLPLCSIVIPAYNAEVWIQRTLQSAAMQRYSNLEILVIDDGSKDNTRKLAEAVSAADNRFRVISIPNGGVANARNLGIREARGQYIAFLDADDIWHPDKIRLQVDAMQEPLDGALPGASYALSRHIDANDRVFSGGAVPGESGCILLRNMYFRFSGNGSSVLVRREVALEVGGYDASWITRESGGCEDIDFELAVAALYPIVCVQQRLVGYRMAPGTMSSNHRAMARGALGVIEKHLKANRQIPSWAARLAYGSILGYTVPKLLDAREWSEFVKHFRVLLVKQPRQGIKFALGVLFRQPRRIMRLLWKRTILIEDSSRPMFYDLVPEIDPSEFTARTPQQQKVLEALRILDVKLWKEKHGSQALSSNSPESNAPYTAHGPLADE